MTDDSSSLLNNNANTAPKTRGALSPPRFTISEYRFSGLGLEVTKQAPRILLFRECGREGLYQINPTVFPIDG